MKINLIYSGLSHFLKNVSNLIIIYFFARALSLNEFGVFSYALMIANIYIILFDYGFNYKLTKDMAQDVDAFEKLMQTAFKLKTLLSVLGIISFFILFNLNVWHENYFWIILLLILSSVFVSFANDLNTPFRVLGKFYVETIHYLFYTVFLVGLSLYALAYHGDLISLSLAFLISRFLFFVISFISVLRINNINVFHRFIQNSNLWFELKEGFPYALQIGSSVLMVSIDTLILERYVSSDDIGIYQAGIKIVIAATFFTPVIQNVLLPNYSINIVNNKKLFVLAHNRNTLYCVTLGGLIVAGILASKLTLIEFLFGEKFYFLQEYIIGFTALIILRYFALTHGLVLTVSGNQKKRLISSLFGNFSLIFFGLALIPIFQIWGALWASIISHMIMYGMYFIYSKREVLL